MSTPPSAASARNATTPTTAADVPASQRGTGRLPALDTLRAVGALAVLVTHVGFHAGAYDEGVLGRLVARMDVGVAIFFVLSGFLLARPWLAAARDGLPAPAVRVYLRRRFWRIYPAYAVVALAVLLLQPSDRETGLGTWVTTLTMTGTFVGGPLPYGFTQTWSLATEVTFYLLLPLLAAVLIGTRGLRPRRILLGLAALVAVNVWWTLYGAAAAAPLGGRTAEWLPAYLTWFAAGLALALVEVAPARLPRAEALLARWGSLPGSCLLVVLGLLLVAGSPLAGPTMLEPATSGESLTKNIVYALVGAVLIVPAVWGDPRSLFIRALVHPLARRIGLISYSVFLVHMLVIELVMATTGFTLFAGRFFSILGLTLVFSLPLAALLYRLVEVPALRWGSRRGSSGGRGGWARRAGRASRATRQTATTDAWPVQADAPAQPASPPQGSST